MAVVFIGFGSNLGNRLQNFATARAFLENMTAFFNIRSSALYHSEPLLRSCTQSAKTLPVDWYLNAVFSCETDLSFHEVFVILQDIEKKMGRTSGKGDWSPRIVDLDLLFYDDVIFFDAVLQIPHPQIAKRKFVLRPLLDLSENFVHPEYQLTLKKLFDLCDDPLQVLPHKEGDGFF